MTDGGSPSYSDENTVRAAPIWPHANLFEWWGSHRLKPAVSCIRTLVGIPLVGLFDAGGRGGPRCLRRCSAPVVGHEKN